MDKDKITRIIKTKPGKKFVVFFIIAVLCLVSGFDKDVKITSAIITFLLFAVISAHFFKRAENIINTNNPNQEKGEIKDSTHKRQGASSQINPDKKIGSYFWVDTNLQKWCIPQGKLKKMVYSYTDIMDFELIEDGNTVTKGGLGRAVAGGVLFGGVGAIVGGVTGGKKTTQTCSKLQIKIVIKDINSPILYIDLISFETKKDTAVYKSAIEAAQEIIAVLQIMCSETVAQ